MWQDVQSMHVILKMSVRKTVRLNFKMGGNERGWIADIGLFRDRSVCCILVMLLFGYF